MQLIGANPLIGAPNDERKTLELYPRSSLYEQRDLSCYTDRIEERLFPALPALPALSDLPAPLESHSSAMESVRVSFESAELAELAELADEQIEASRIS